MTNAQKNTAARDAARLTGCAPLRGSTQRSLDLRTRERVLVLTDGLGGTEVLDGYRLETRTAKGTRYARVRR